MFRPSVRVDNRGVKDKKVSWTFCTYTKLHVLVHLVITLTAVAIVVRHGVLMQYEGSFVCLWFVCAPAVCFAGSTTVSAPPCFRLRFFGCMWDVEAPWMDARGGGGDTLPPVIFDMGAEDRYS